MSTVHSVRRRYQQGRLLIGGCCIPIRFIFLVPLTFFLNTWPFELVVEMLFAGHQGGDAPGIVADGKNDGNCTGLTTPVSDCPFNFWRTAGDPYPDWGTTMRELNTLRHVINPNYDGECGSGGMDGGHERVGWAVAVSLSPISLSPSLVLPLSLCLSSSPPSLSPRSSLSLHVPLFCFPAFSSFCLC